MTDDYDQGGILKAEGWLEPGRITPLGKIYTEKGILESQNCKFVQMETKHDYLETGCMETEEIQI